MKLTFTVKQLGKKHPLIRRESIDVELDRRRVSLNALIAAVVRQQVAVYNSKTDGRNLIDYLSPSDIASQSETGKVGFGAIYNDAEADPEQAVETALLAFEDGIFAVFEGDRQIESINEMVTVDDAHVFTFIRLAFLAGAIW